MEGRIRRAGGKICPDDTLAMPKLLSYVRVCNLTSSFTVTADKIADLRWRLSADGFHCIPHRKGQIPNLGHTDWVLILVYVGILEPDTHWYFYELELRLGASTCTRVHVKKSIFFALLNRSTLKANEFFLCPCYTPPRTSGKISLVFFSVTLRAHDTTQTALNTTSLADVNTRFPSSFMASLNARLSVTLST